MDKKEEFKEFIKTKPELVNYVKDKKYTWQDFYEVYDIYGTDESVWNKYKEEVSFRSDNSSLKELTSLVKNINLDNVQKYINNAQKAINVISELTSSKSASSVIPNEIPKTPRVINKYLNRGPYYYKYFLSAFKENNKEKRKDKTNEVFNTLDTVNTILKIMK